MSNVDHFALLKLEIPTFDKLGSKSGALRHFGQEVMRFHAIAATLLENMKLDASSVDERYITHILARSVIESFLERLHLRHYRSTRCAIRRVRELIQARLRKVIQ